MGARPGNMPLLQSLKIFVVLVAITMSVRTHLPAQRPSALMSGMLPCPNFKLMLLPLIRCRASLGESHSLEYIQTILSTMTPHINPLIARSESKTGKDQEPCSPQM